MKTNESSFTTVFVNGEVDASHVVSTFQFIVPLMVTSITTYVDARKRPFFLHPAIALSGASVRMLHERLA